MQLKETNIAEQVLGSIPAIRGMMWEKIKEFQNKLNELEGVLNHEPGEQREEGWDKYFPLKQHLEGGLYTRELFMPKGSVVVSMIHKQNHPSFFLEGEMSILTDAGEVKRIKAPMKVMTEIGTQRVAYMHEDCKWVCVYRTDKTEIKDAQKDVYTLNYKDLPQLVINKKKLLCQD